MQITDTIAAISSGLTEAGIGVIRVSGEKAFEIADRVVQLRSGEKLADSAGYRAHYGHAVENGEVIDEVLALVLRAPASYTAEDTVEIYCHGSLLSLRKTLEAVIHAGARIADPGEFTKRAFLNGRLDLSQAEAVMDLIRAKNDYALSASVHQLSGSVSERIRALREELLFHIARIESALDDPEHYSLEGYDEELEGVIAAEKTEIGRLAESFSEGKLLTEGIRTVILGKPNAGKSSLMNLLVGEEKAIVTEIAGTTRDVLEEQILLAGLGLRIVDTAGIRETGDVIEKMGVDRARKQAEEADLIIYVADASVPLDQDDEEVISLIRGRRALVLLNKSDLPQVVTREELERITGEKVLTVSVLEGTGTQEIGKTIREMFELCNFSYNDQVVITNIRHKQALEEALAALSRVEESLSAGLPEDFYSIDLTDAYNALGSILGESMDEDVINEIFSKFCMGK